MTDDTTLPETESSDESDGYTPLSLNVEGVDEDLIEDGLLMEHEDVDIPYRNTDHITDVINGLRLGEDVILQIGTEEVDVYHEAEVVSRNPVGTEPYDWDNVICFDIPPNDDEETRRYVAGEISTEVGLWYIVSFGYESVVMNEIAVDDMWGHGWIIEVARA